MVHYSVWQWKKLLFIAPVALFFFFTNFCSTNLTQLVIDRESDKQSLFAIVHPRPTWNISSNGDISNNDMKTKEGGAASLLARPFPSIGPKCPLAAQRNVGLFNTSVSTSEFQNEFRNVILVVSCNNAYYDMLLNWEYLAKKLGLQWAVLALDETLYRKLGKERAIPPEHDFSVSGTQTFRRGQFNKLSCNKMRMVMEVAQHCDMDVVFSDVDNIFYHNPFEHDLGRLIYSDHYEYVYQTNGGAPPQPLQDACLNGSPHGVEGNTGFYYVSRNSLTIHGIVNSTLERCADPSNELDDQSLFWKEFHKVRKQRLESDTPMHHCDVPEYLEPLSHNENSSRSSFNYCCLDPFYYPVGTPNPPRNKDPITYHANFVRGHNGKINKLRTSRADGYGWDKSRTAKTGCWFCCWT